ncbi:MAG TPA: hypothetical protein VFF33_14930 [Ignavibacteriaceae bacterium]|nr:hypothetical protein [Ignavibacteriaceae bacterium]
MKKFAIIIALLFVTASFAQHTNIVNQTGDVNSSVVTQLLSGLPLLGSDNFATLDQAGSYNTSDIYQINNGSFGQGQFAQVDQFGWYNFSDVDQLNGQHTGIVYQQGNSNIADIYQNGVLNYGEVTSVGNNNQGYIIEFAVGSTGWIKQFGNVNLATQDLGQDWGINVVNSIFTTLQNGSYNTAHQYLEGDLTGYMGGSEAVDNLGTIAQHGWYNFGQQTMMDGGMQDAVDFVAEGNTATLYQQGNSNTSYQLMRRNDNTSVVNQVGNNNTSFSFQNW